MEENNCKTDHTYLNNIGRKLFNNPQPTHIKCSYLHIINMTTPKTKPNTRKQQKQNLKDEQADKAKAIKKLWLRGSRSSNEQDIWDASQ